MADQSANSGTTDYAAFCTVRKNRDACIHWLLRLGQQIERTWQQPEGRVAGLSLLRQCLESLAEHAHADCRELAALAPRMLRSLDFEERHFLNLMLPIERKYSKGLRDDEFLTGTGAGAAFLVRSDDRHMVRSCLPVPLCPLSTRTRRILPCARNRVSGSGYARRVWFREL